MTSDTDISKTDDYYVTALQIFEYCGAEGSGTLRVDALMDKFAPFVKTNKSEYSYLKSLLDPEQDNPEINVTKLARALNKYSESQKSKLDLDESFNLKCGHAPQDSDSGISTDGYQLLEELQSELREKSHLASQLRSQLEFTDRQHEEVLAALVAERDSLRAHLNILREENISLTHLRRDYDEVCERLCTNEAELETTRHDLDAVRRRAKPLDEHLAHLEAENAALQDLLSKSKEECHRVNEMYALRQSALLEENETIRSSHADLTARMQDQEEFLQQIIKEKVQLEMELKDLLNKSNHTHLRLDRSIDVSYTEDQMLTALDSLNADSRFSQDNHLLDEESFLNALKEDQGRATNMSLFDEIRLSITANLSKHNVTNNTPLSKFEDKFQYLDNSFNCLGTQSDTNNIEPYHSRNNESLDKSMSTIGTQTYMNYIFHSATSTVETQTDNFIKNETCDVVNVVFTKATQTVNKIKHRSHIGTQTEDFHNNNNLDACMDCLKCYECENLKKQVSKLESDLRKSQQIIRESETDLAIYENNLGILQKLVNDGTESNSLLQEAINNLESKIVTLEAACANQRDIIEGLNSELCFAHTQTDSDVTSVATQMDVPCADCMKRSANASPRGLRRYFWDPLKCLFQVFAVICFLCAVSALYGVSRRPHQRCEQQHVPWRWIHAQDILDLLLRIDYLAEVPM